LILLGLVIYFVRARACGEWPFGNRVNRGVAA